MMARHAFRVCAVTALVVASMSCRDDGAVRAPTAAAMATSHVLRVQGDGAGSGTVTAPDASPRIDCSITGGALSGVCAMAYPSNSAVRLIAVPDAGSTFRGWSGACTGAGQCVVEMSNERAATAAFGPTR